MEINSSCQTTLDKKLDEKYFYSYEDLEIHKLMLTDNIRTETYRTAIASNQELFKNKIVLDIGAGTGILSVFCAQAGASKVFAVEASNVAKIAELVVKENKFSDIIQVFHSSIEDVELPTKVDIIVSEWMGFYLLHEGMLDSIICARNKFLVEGGIMFPEECYIYTAPCELKEFFGAWDDVCGVKMSDFGKELRKSYQLKPVVTCVRNGDLLSDGNEVCKFNLNSLKTADIIKINKKFIIPSERHGKFQGVCIWFTVIFPETESCDPTILSTSPFDPPTHWKQTVIVLPGETEVEEQEPIAYELLLTRTEETSRSYNICLTILDPEKEKHPVPCHCYLTKCIVIKTYLEQSGTDANSEDAEIIDISNEQATENDK